MLSIYPTVQPRESSDRGENNFFTLLAQLLGQKVYPFSSARAGIVFGLQALGMTRMDEILVPPYLSHCVISALAKTSFPVLKPSERTKAILVYHQLGFPQHLNQIEEEARKHGWWIVNNCVNTLFSRYQEQFLAEWGDFTVFSFSKLYPCNLGGGLLSNHDLIHKRLEQDYPILSEQHLYRSREAYEMLLRTKQHLRGVEDAFDVNAVYGYLPDLIAFPPQAGGFLPCTLEEIQQDRDRRRKLLSILQNYFPDSIAVVTESDIVPFAIPVRTKGKPLEPIEQITKQLNIELPILHFDFAQNMLNPNYEKSFIFGAHPGWSEDRVNSLCQWIQQTMN
ncbi:DegT/DnrJ/EryC1/StrS family aminotransferase [Deltaproteobacteria bacterium TL4]